MSIKLKYLHGEDDEDLNEAQRVLDNKLLWSREPACISALSHYLQNYGMLLVEDSLNGSSLQARTLNLDCFSKVGGNFSWLLDTTHFAHELLDASVTEAAKGHPLSLYCCLDSVRVGHFTREDSMLDRLGELADKVQPGTTRSTSRNAKCTAKCNAKCLVYFRHWKFVVSYYTNLIVRKPCDLTFKYICQLSKRTSID